MIKEGQTVYHKQYGKGTVKQYLPGQSVEVSFDEHGEKNLKTDYTSLKDKEGNELIEARKKEEEKAKKSRGSGGIYDNQYSIVQETKKAYKIADDQGNETFVPKGWVEKVDDNTVQSSKKQFAKRVINKFSEESEKQKNKIEIPKPCFSIERETQKAILANIKFETVKSIPPEFIKVWLPKSKVEHDSDQLKVQQEFWNEKLEEISEKNGYVETDLRETNTGNGLYKPVILYEVLSEQSIKRNFFVPKKLAIFKNGNIWQFPKWFFNQKVDELKSEAAKGSFSEHNIRVEAEFTFIDPKLAECKNDDKKSQKSKEKASALLRLRKGMKEKKAK